MRLVRCRCGLTPRVTDDDDSDVFTVTHHAVDDKTCAGSGEKVRIVRWVQALLETPAGVVGASLGLRSGEKP